MVIWPFYSTYYRDSSLLEEAPDYGGICLPSGEKAKCLYVIFWVWCINQIFCHVLCRQSEKLMIICTCGLNLWGERMSADFMQIHCCARAARRNLCIDYALSWQFWHFPQETFSPASWQLLLACPHFWCAWYFCLSNCCIVPCFPLQCHGISFTLYLCSCIQFSVIFFRGESAASLRPIGCALLWPSQILLRLLAIIKAAAPNTVFGNSFYHPLLLMLARILTYNLKQFVAGSKREGE